MEVSYVEPKTISCKNVLGEEILKQMLIFFNDSCWWWVVVVLPSFRFDLIYNIVLVSGVQLQILFRYKLLLDNEYSNNTEYAVLLYSKSLFILYTVMCIC